MFIELVDSLRCPHVHADSWLVLSTERMDGRNVMEGVLGCPVCRAEFPILGGIADLRTEPSAVEAAGAGRPADAEQGLRLAAFLSLTEAHGFALLAGRWTRHAPAVQAVSEVHLLLVNPEPGVAIGAGTSGLRIDARLPLAIGSARGAALDAAHAALAGDAAQAVSAGGRLVAPLAVDVPAGVTELVRDASVWVGEREAGASGLIPLARGKR
jgi:uncharacterized protein YbaR (Trm112 family)